MYESYDIIDGKPELEGLPASFAGDEMVQTLILHMADKGTDLKLTSFTLCLSARMS